MPEWLLNLIIVFVGSGTAVVAIQFVTEQWREGKNRVEATKHLAQQLAFLLEGYAIECAGRAVDHEMAVENEGHAGQYLGSVPDAPQFPESSDYRLLDRGILNDIFDFPQRCQMADRAVGFWWDVVGDRDAMLVAAEESTLKMGGLAFDIAKKLRIKYKLRPRDLTFEQWDVGAYLKAELEKLREVEKRRRERDAADIPDAD